MADRMFGGPDRWLICKTWGGGPDSPWLLYPPDPSGGAIPSKYHELPTFDAARELFITLTQGGGVQCLTPGCRTPAAS